MYFLGGQNCIDNPEVNQQGNYSSIAGRQVIVPNASINCNIRITGVAVSMNSGGFRDGDLPLVLIWRPSSPRSSLYNRVAQIQLSNGTLFGGSSGY